MQDIIRKIKNTVEINPTLSAMFDIVAGTLPYKMFINLRVSQYLKYLKETKKYNIIIETTNACNAHCAMCPHIHMKRKVQTMDDSTFNTLISRLKEESINPLVFIVNGFGDPLTDVKIFDRIKLLRKNFPDSAIKFYSNFRLANDKIIEQAVDSGITEINISFNGYNKENYEKTMGIDYDATLNNLTKLLDTRQKKNSALKVRLSMAMVSYNDGDERKFIETWEKKVDSISVNKVHTYGGAVSDISGTNKINFNKFTYPCKYLWNTIVVSVTGDILLCCLDYEASHVFGNIKDSKILDIFYSPKLEAVRKMHMQNNIKNFNICAKCYTPYKNGVEWFIRDLY